MILYWYEEAQTYCALYPTIHSDQSASPLAGKLCCQSYTAESRGCRLHVLTARRPIGCLPKPTRHSTTVKVTTLLPTLTINYAYPIHTRRDRSTTLGWMTKSKLLHPLIWPAVNSPSRSPQHDPLMPC